MVKVYPAKGVNVVVNHGWLRDQQRKATRTMFSIYSFIARSDVQIR